jgi:uroporphyrinogen decarboxylase
MKQKIIDYVIDSNERVVSPIWGGKRAFDFLTMGFLNFAEAMGFELEKISPNLTIVKEGQLITEEQINHWIEEQRFETSFFDREIEYLGYMQTWEIAKYHGGGCFGPLTVVGELLGVDNMLRMIVKNPGYVERALDYVTGYMIDLAQRETKAGQDFFWIAEPMASLLAPKLFWEFSGKYLKRIFAAAAVPGFLHVCGKTTAHTRLLEETGAILLSIDYCSDIGECIRMVDERTIIMGNVSPMTLRYGTKEEVEKETSLVLDKCRGYRNFVLSTGCSVIDGTPEEHIQVLFDLAQQDLIT